MGVENAAGAGNLPGRFGESGLTARRTWYATLNSMKTNAVWLLDTLGVRYELREYQLDPAAVNADTVARQIGWPADRTPRQYLRIVVFRLDRSQKSKHATRRRTLWPEGTLFEMVHLGCEELASEDLDRWISSIPIDAN
jgi:hypothetical protein